MDHVESTEAAPVQQPSVLPIVAWLDELSRTSTTAPSRSTRAVDDRSRYGLTRLPRSRRGAIHSPRSLITAKRARDPAATARPGLGTRRA
jgi:hypothetical protein